MPKYFDHTSCPWQALAETFESLTLGGGGPNEGLDIGQLPRPAGTAAAPAMASQVHGGGGGMTQLRSSHLLPPA